jgi:arylsulfatase A-like enzyme
MPIAILRKRWPWLAAAALVVVVYVASLSIRVVGGDPRPLGGAAEIESLRARKDVNVLFVLIDTLRGDRLGAFGYARPTTPSLDLLAASGVRFTRHLAQSSWTKCSMASLWTGLYPARDGVTRFDQVVPSEAKLPAEILKEAGFRTVGLYRNGWVAPNFGFGQGFEVYDKPRARPVPLTVRRDNPTLKDAGSDDDVVDAALEFLRVHGRERWFLYLHLMDVHEFLYDEESAIFGTSSADVYDNSILHLDGILDRFLGELASDGQLARTVVVVVADHGEAFGERGYEGHAREVYRETTEIPWILAFPFRLERGAVVEVRTRNIDVWPTLLDLLGLPALPVADGRSLVPEIVAAVRGEAPTREVPAAFAHLDRYWGQAIERSAPMVAVSQDGIRYVTLRDGPRVTEDLFDAKLDPKELSSVLAERPEEAARMRSLVDAYLASPPAFSETPEKLELDEIQLNQLRALGYAVP